MAASGGPARRFPALAHRIRVLLALERQRRHCLAAQPAARPLPWRPAGLGRCRYAGRLVAWAAALRLRVQLVRRRLAHAFEVLPRRWVVKRTFAWLSRYRRTVRDYERLPAHHQAMVQWAMITIMTRRLARRHRPARTPTPALARAA
jgi:transposase